MRSMFMNTEMFNRDISGWEVSRVQNARSMFYNALAFNQNLCDWGTRLLSLEFYSFMFTDAACSDKTSPSLETSPVGPLCSVCT